MPTQGTQLTEPNAARPVSGADPEDRALLESNPRAGSGDSSSPHVNGEEGGLLAPAPFFSRSDPAYVSRPFFCHFCSRTVDPRSAHRVPALAFPRCPHCGHPNGSRPKRSISPPRPKGKGLAVVKRDRDTQAVQGELIANKTDVDATLDKCGKGGLWFWDEDKERAFFVRLRCHLWTCPTCGPIKQAQWAAIARAGRPDRHLVLTTGRNWKLSLSQAIAWLRKAFEKFRKWLNKTFGYSAYICVVELHEDGWPHLHVLLRGPYLPEPQLMRKWHELTGSKHIWITKKDTPSRYAAEVSKYLTKNIPAMKQAGFRGHAVSKSNDWLPPDWTWGDPPSEHCSYLGLVRLPPQEMLGLLQRLGVGRGSDPDCPERFYMEFRGPPDREELSRIFDVNVFAEVDLANVVCAAYGLTTGRYCDMAECQAGMDLAADRLAVAF